MNALDMLLEQVLPVISVLRFFSGWLFKNTMDFVRDNVILFIIRGRVGVREVTSDGGKGG